MRWKMECILKKGVGLHKRTGPSISYRIVGKWYRGNTFVADQVKNVGIYTWYRIEGTTYWSCGKKGKEQYLKLVADLEPKVEPTPPNKPTPNPDPPYVAPTEPTRPKSDYALESSFGNVSESEWYLPSKHINASKWDNDVIKQTARLLSTSTASAKAKTRTSKVTPGRWDPVSDEVLRDEISRVRYNMDIAYRKKNEAYDYTMSSGYFTDIQSKIHNSFNRNKTVITDYHLSKTFAYVFFTRPDCNIVTKKNGVWKLASGVDADPKYSYLLKNNSNTLTSLVKDGNPNHDFLVLLSNEARSYEVSDHVIQTVNHGETYTGGKVVYGKSDHESNTSGEVSIRYTDSVNLDIFKLHTVWVDYINKVYRGVVSPKRNATIAGRTVDYVLDKILDYASSCYYFLCGPDGQTILYWQKLTGVFPVNTGESTFSWDCGTLLSKPDINIKYVYSMKTPMDVVHLEEFNKRAKFNPKIHKIKTTYSPEQCCIGSTLTGAPCVVKSSIGGKLCYRLMWRDI